MLEENLGIIFGIILGVGVFGLMMYYRKNK